MIAGRYQKGYFLTVDLHSGDWLSKLPCLGSNSVENNVPMLSVESASRFGDSSETAASANTGEKSAR